MSYLLIAILFVKQYILILLINTIQSNPRVTKTSHLWKSHLIFFFCVLIIDIFYFWRCPTKGTALRKELTGLQACNFTKKRLQHRRFPVNIVNFKNTYFEKHLRTAGSDSSYILYRKFIKLFRKRIGLPDCLFVFFLNHKITQFYFLSSVFICFITRYLLLYRWFSLVVSLVVIRCTTWCHSLWLVVIRCTTCCHSLSLVVIWCYSMYHSSVFYDHCFIIFCFLNHL